VTRFLSIDLSDFDVTKLAGLDEKVVDVLRDAAYVTVGFGVLAVQKAQVRRRELGAIVGRAQRVVATVHRQALGVVESAR
jgi:hypothetical protein